MHRITEEQERELRGLLDRFRSDHPTMRIEPRMLDLTSCFIRGGVSKVPKYWYDGDGSPSVKAYVVRNGPMLKKFDSNSYTVNDDGRKVYRRIPYQQTSDFKVLSALCARATRNTGVSEFIDFKSESWNPAGLPTIEKMIYRIEDTIRTLCGGDYNPFTDNAFIFCRATAEEAESAVRLNAIWMDIIGRRGESFISDAPFPHESGIARKVFPEDFFSNPTEDLIQRESYQHGVNAHTKESEWFMAKIAERYSTEMKIKFSEELEGARATNMKKKREVLDLVESRGEDGIDFMELYYSGEVERGRELGEALAILHLERGFGSVVQNPPKHYFEAEEDVGMFHKFYGGRPYYRIYSNDVVQRMLAEGKISEAVGFGVPQLPHYVLSQPAAAEA